MEEKIVCDLSVVIPCYQGEDFIDRCLDSVIEISGFSYEVIIINDGSTDSSESRINKYIEKGYPIKLVNQTNAGVSVAINNGLNLVKGRYLTVLAIDDWYDPLVISKIMHLTIKNSYEICGFKIQSIGEKGENLGIGINHPIKYNEESNGCDFLATGYQPSSICPFVFESAFIQDNKFRFVEDVTHNDVEISLRLFLKAKKVYFTDYVGYFYYRHQNSITLSVSEVKLKKYVSDMITVGYLMKENCKSQVNPLINATIMKQSNSVIWNLLLRLFKNKDGFSASYMIELKTDLINRKLYPIQGPLKTRFQRITRIVMNSHFFWSILKLKSK